MTPVPNGFARDLDASLEALGVDHVDLFQLHWPDPKVPFAETAGALQGLVDEGKTRHVGVSNFDTAQMAEFAETRPVETLQPPYDLFRRGIEAGDFALLPRARHRHFRLRALAHGLLTGYVDENTTFATGDWRSAAPFFKGENFHRNLEAVRELQRFASERFGLSVSRLAIAWTLANPAVDAVIVGARQPASYRGQRRRSGARPEQGRPRADRPHHGRLRLDGRPPPGDDARVTDSHQKIGFVGLGAILWSSSTWSEEWRSASSHRLTAG